MVNYIHNSFQQKYHTEILQLREEDFGHELQQMFSFFGSDVHEIKIRDPTENFDPYC